jgi:hypothetical protein
MLDREQIEQKLKTWMVEFVEQPNPLLGNWAPCPYARAARLNNKISVRFCSVSEFNDAIKNSCTDLDSKDVVIICFDHRDVDPITLQEWVTETNRGLMAENYIVLEDHPDAPEYINGVKMNFGLCGLLLLQRLTKLTEASEQLKEKGYYSNWSKENLDYVVNWRNREIRTN